MKTTNQFVTALPAGVPSWRMDICLVFIWCILLQAVEFTVLGVGCAPTPLMLIYIGCSIQGISTLQGRLPTMWNNDSCCIKLVCKSYRWFQCDLLTKGLIKKRVCTHSSLKDCIGLPGTNHIKVVWSAKDSSPVQ